MFILLPVTNRSRLPLKRGGNLPDLLSPLNLIKTMELNDNAKGFLVGLDLHYANRPIQIY